MSQNIGFHFDYADLEIRIFKREESGYPVELTLNHELHYERGWLSLDLPANNASALQSWFFADPNFKTSWARAIERSPHCRLRLRLDAEAPELHMLPWELLSDDKTFFAADAATPFSRYWLTDVPLDEPLSVHPLKVLVVISNPSDLEQYQSFPLDVSTEQALLETPFQQLSPKYVQLDFLFAPVTLDRLETALGEGYQVLHFVGHGAFNRSKQQTELYFQDTTDAASPVAEADIVSLFQRLGSKQRPRLVVLEACHSAAMVGVEHGLLSVGIPAVVAMQDTITVDSARQLTRVFYEQLVQHGRVDVALNRARSNLLSVNRSDAGVPVLFMRLQDGQLWQPIWSLVNPYRGLAAFKTEDADFFFGREKLIQELLERTRQQCFLAVVGSSGSGKSSVVQAGLLPRLPQDWNVVVFRPGADPWAALQAVGLPGLAEKEIVQATEGKPLLLFIDQFEELFTLTPAKMRTPFLEALQKLIESYVLAKVVLALRADFYGYLQSSPLGRLLDQNVVNVLPLEAAEFQEAIVKPADKVGLCFEPGLVEIITTEIKTVNQPLPLLQSALTQLWERQKHGWLTQSAYVAVGRVAGAMGLWADKAFGQMGEEERVLARRILTRLVYYGETDVGDTRRRCTLEELAGAASEVEFSHRLVKELADARLLTTIDEGGVVKVEIIHDALLHQWGKLREWIAEQREFGLWRQWLDAQRETWKSKSRDESTLLRGKLLTEAEFWLQKRPGELNPLEKEYIQAGIALREREQRAKALLQQKILIGMAATLAVFLVLTVLAGMGWEFSTTSRMAAESMSLPDWQYDLSLLLGVEAFNRQDTFQTRGSLLSALESHSQLIVFFRGHDSVVSSVAFSPDGKWIASGSWNCRILLQNTTTGLVKTLWQPQDKENRCSIYSMGFSPDSRTFATAGFGQVMLWEVGNETFTVSSTLPVDNYAINEVVFSRDGSELAAGSASGKAFLWDMKHLSRPIVLSGDKGPINDLAFSPDGQILATANTDRSVILWDVKASDPLSLTLTKGCNSMNGAEDFGSMHGIAFVPNSPDITLVIGGHKNGLIYVCEISTSPTLGATSKMTLTESDSPVSVLAVGPNGTTLASGNTDGTIKIWDMSSGKLINTLVGHSGSIQDLAFSPDGKQLLSSNKGILLCWLERDGVSRVWGCGDSTVILWDLEIRQRLGTLLANQRSSVRRIAFSADGTKLVASQEDSTLHLWDVIAEPEFTTVFSATHWADSECYGRAITLGQEITITGFRHQTWGIAVNPEGTILASDAGDQNIHLWQLGSGNTLSITSEITLLGHQGAIKSLAFSADGRTLASASDDKTIILWDITNGIPSNKKVLYGHQSTIESIAFNPKGTLLASGGREDRTLILWNLNQTSPFSMVLRSGNANVHDSYVRTVAFSPDGKYLASGSADHTVVLWKIQDSPLTYTIHARLTGHHNEVYSVAFSPDGKILASGSEDRTIILWDVATGKMLGNPLTGHKGTVYSLAFSPFTENLTLVSSSVDGTIMLWNIDPKSWKACACQTVNRNLTREEWNQYIGDLAPYRATCPNLPIDEP